MIMERFVGIGDRKRIAILIGGLPPIYNGGAENDTMNIAHFASKAGHDVHVLALDGTNRGETEYHIDGAEIHRIGITLIPYMAVPTYVPKMLSIIAKLKPDLIHAQNIPMALSAYIANLFMKYPYMVHSRGEMNIKWAFKNQVARLVMGRAERVVAQTEHMRQGLQKVLNRDIEVIPNGINLANYKPMSKSEARTKLGLPSSLRLIAFVGRARPEKNLLGFIETMNCLRNRNDCYAVVVGDGQQLETAKCLADTLGLNIVFKGNVDNKEIPLYMYAADVMVNTSFSEGFPTTFLEAFAAGLPIIAPRVCGIPEIVESGVNGFIVEPKPQAYAYAVSRILNDDKLLEIMSRNNLKKARDYSWEAIVKRLYG